MPTPPEMLAAKQLAEEFVMSLPGVTGIDVGLADLEARDPNNLAIRIFVASLESLPLGLPSEFQGVPVVILEGRFTVDQLPDTKPYRPIKGGVSCGPARPLMTPQPHYGLGTLGAICRDVNTGVAMGLSNFHVLASDNQHQVQTDVIVQPENTILGHLPSSDAGILWTKHFPENVPSGPLDAAAFVLTKPAIAEIEEIGPVIGSRDADHGDIVKKRGRTTGLTHGFVAGLSGTFTVDAGPYGPKRFTDQMTVNVDFPSSVTWSDKGDSGSVVVDGLDRAVGLHFASNDILGQSGLANPIRTVETQLGVSLTWPIPAPSFVLPGSGTPGSSVIIFGSGFSLATKVQFGGVDAPGFTVLEDHTIFAEVPGGSGTVDITVEGPGGSGSGAAFEIQ